MGIPGRRTLIPFQDPVLLQLVEIQDGNVTSISCTTSELSADGKLTLGPLGWNPSLTCRYGFLVFEQ
jgi:hypothetical protein